MCMLVYSIANGSYYTYYVGSSMMFELYVRLIKLHIRDALAAYF